MTPSDPSVPRWEHFFHEADIGIRGYGYTPEEAFEQGALALCAVLTDPAGVRPQERLPIDVESTDLDLLFVEWLDALIYPMATRGLVCSRFEISMEGSHLRATAWGEAVDPARHAPAVEVKGATFTALAVSRSPSGVWCAQCIVDV